MSHFSVAVFTRPDEDYESLLAPFDEEVEPGSEYAEFIEDDDCDFDETAGKNGYWSNPDAKWDWYALGGRWSGELTLKDGGQTDSAPVRDCEFKKDKDDYRRAIRFWEVYVDGQPLKYGESKDDFDAWYKPEYYRDQYKTKENYASSVSEFRTYAFVTEDGEWFETGHMGWFGMDDATAESRDTYEEAFRKQLKQAEENDLVITIVDCHI